MYKIFDTDDATFANQVAGVSTAEWQMYKELHAKLRELEDKERPYERIKPSLRKAFERQIKERRVRAEGEIMEGDEWLLSTSRINEVVLEETRMFLLFPIETENGFVHEMKSF